jgi:hypothetical protein
MDFISSNEYLEASELERLAFAWCEILFPLDDIERAVRVSDIVGSCNAIRCPGGKKNAVVKVQPRSAHKVAVRHIDTFIMQSDR